jgi:hypothetical protein
MGGEQSRPRRRNDYDDRRRSDYNDRRGDDRDLESGGRGGPRVPPSEAEKHSMYEKRDKLEKKEQREDDDDNRSVKSHKSHKSTKSVMKHGYPQWPGGGSKAPSLKGKSSEKAPSVKPEEEKPPLHEVDTGVMVQVW